MSNPTFPDDDPEDGYDLEDDPHAQIDVFERVVADLEHDRDGRTVVRVLLALAILVALRERVRHRLRHEVDGLIARLQVIR